SQEVDKRAELRSRSWRLRAIRKHQPERTGSTPSFEHEIVAVHQPHRAAVSIKGPQHSTGHVGAKAMRHPVCPLRPEQRAHFHLAERRILRKLAQGGSREWPDVR